MGKLKETRLVGFGQVWLCCLPLALLLRRKFLETSIVKQVQVARTSECTARKDAKVREQSLESFVSACLGKKQDYKASYGSVHREEVPAQRRLSFVLICLCIDSLCERGWRNC